MASEISIEDRLNDVSHRAECYDLMRQSLVTAMESFQSYKEAVLRAVVGSVNTYPDKRPDIIDSQLEFIQKSMNTLSGVEDLLDTALVQLLPLKTFVSKELEEIERLVDSKLLP